MHVQDPLTSALPTAEISLTSTEPETRPSALSEGGSSTTIVMVPPSAGELQVPMPVNVTPGWSRFGSSPIGVAGESAPWALAEAEGGGAVPGPGGAGRRNRMAGGPRAAGRGGAARAGRSWA